MASVNRHRPRLTKATVRRLPMSVLEEAYAKTQIFLRCEREELLKPSAIDAAKSRKHHALLRNELLRRKVEDVDIEPEIPEGLRKELEAATLALIDQQLDDARVTVAEQVKAHRIENAEDLERD